jgi:hypothetical protein
MYVRFNIFLVCLYVVQKQELQIVRVVWFEIKTHSTLTYISLFAFELILQFLSMYILHHVFE